jgi:hypothetical protein
VSVAFNHQGILLAVAEDYQRIRLLDARTGEEDATLWKLTALHTELAKLGLDFNKNRSQGEKNY